MINVSRIQRALAWMMFVCCLLTATACSRSSPSDVTTKTGGQLSVGLPAEPATLDPAAAGDGASYSVYQYALEGLAAVDERGALVPMLATSWKPNGNATEYRVTLRERVRFHDGSNLDAKVVKDNFDRLIEPSSKLVGSAVFRGLLSGVVTTSDSSILFRLSKPKATFPYDLANTYSKILSEGSLTGSPSERSSQPIGTGPFKVSSWARGDRVMLTKFDGYWGKAPTLDRVNLRFIPDAGARFAALQAGDVQVVANPSFASVQSVTRQNNGAAKLARESGIEAYTYQFNLRRKHFQDARVRTALNLAIDKKSLAQVVYGGLASVLDSPMSTRTNGYAPAGEYPYDPERAKALLKEAGHESDLKLTLWAPEDRYLNARQLDGAVAGYLRAVGVDVRIVPMENTSFLAKLSATSGSGPGFDLALINAQSGTGDCIQLWHLYLQSTSRPPNGFNITAYANSTVDSMIAKAEAQVDESKRNQINADIAKVVWKDAPWIFTVSPDQTALIAGKVDGVTFGIVGPVVTYATFG